MYCRRQSKNQTLLRYPIHKLHGYYIGALAHEARAAEHHGQENVVNYPSEKIWQSRDRTPTDRPSTPQAYQRKISGSLW